MDEDYAKLLTELVELFRIPRGLEPSARSRALIAVEERHREAQVIVDRVRYSGLDPAEAITELRSIRWTSPMPTGPKLSTI